MSQLHATVRLTIVRLTIASVALALAAAWSAPIMPAFAVWNESASSDTTSARHVILFIVDVIVRLLGMGCGSRRQRQDPPWRRINIRAWAALVCPSVVSGQRTPRVPTQNATKKQGPDRVSARWRRFRRLSLWAQAWPACRSPSRSSRHRNCRAAPTWPASAAHFFRRAPNAWPIGQPALPMRAVRPRASGSKHCRAVPTQQWSR